MPEPLSPVSILSFDDAVELFVQLATEHLNIPAKRPEFMEYWSLIPSLTLSVAMKRVTLSAARNRAIRRITLARVNPIKPRRDLPDHRNRHSFPNSIV